MIQSNQKGISMKKLSQLVFLLSCGFVMASAVNAQQTRQLIKPADSTSITAHAGPTIVVPDLSRYVQFGQIPGIVSSMIPASTAYDRPWTSYFLGSTRCGTDPYVGTFCGTIISDGSLKVTVGYDPTFNPLTTSKLAAPMGKEMVTAPIGFVGQNSSGAGQFVADATAGPVLSVAQKLAGAAPNDWSFMPYSTYVSNGGL